MAPAELYAVDGIGLPKFTVQQAKAVIDMVRTRGLLNSPALEMDGRGIVIAGGGRYLDWSWALCRRLREHLKTELPIQVWHLGPKEMPEWARPRFRAMDVETVDAHRVMMQHPVREMGGWHLKTYAVRHCPWRHAMFIDADCYPEIQPEELFNDKDVRSIGSLFFHDVGKHHSAWGYVDCGLVPLEKEWETGQFIWDKQQAWTALRWALWMHEHTDVFYQNFHGDKGVIEAAIRMTQAPHLMGGPSEWQQWGIEHSFKGRAAFRHVMAAKRGECPKFPWLEALFEEWRALSFGRKAA